MKICTKCDKEKLDSSFAWKDRERGLKHSWCKDCHKEYNKQFYIENREQEKKRVYKRREKHRNWLREYKLGLQCEKCGERHPACITFHHKGEKEGEISRLIGRGWSIKRLEEEIEKCSVLCFNCHMKLHWDNNKT